MSTLANDVRHHHALGERYWDDAKSVPMGFDENVRKPVLWLRVQSHRTEDQHALSLVYEPPGSYDSAKFPDVAEDLECHPDSRVRRRQERRNEFSDAGGFDGGPLSCAYEIAKERAGLWPGDDGGALHTSQELRQIIQELEAAQVRESLRKTDPDL